MPRPEIRQSRLHPSHDLELVALAGADDASTWDATGDDPGFLIKLPFVRRPFVVILVESLGAPLDPQLYVDHGTGFSERGSVVLEPGLRHVLLVDVGVVGTIRKLRFDPATAPGRFKIRIEHFGRRGEAEAELQRLAAQVPDTRLQRLLKLNRFWFAGQRWPAPFRSTSVADHAAAIYAMAGREPVIDSPVGERWLSLVVPVFNPPPRYLDDLVASFRSQGVAGTELILSDDGSGATDVLAWLDKVASWPQDDAAPVRVIRNPVNLGIAAATNAAIEAASGRWIGLVDHDDVLAPHALKRILATLAERPDTAFLYTDELVVDDKLRATGYMLKPAFDPVLLTGVNYINHLSIYRRSRLNAIGRLRMGYEGSQDYDLLLRYLEGVPDEAIVHLPYPAYWWRRTGQTYSRTFLEQSTASARRALSEAMANTPSSVSIGSAISGTLHRVTFASASESPRISIVVPSKDAYAHIARLLPDLFERTEYPDFEVIVIDNGTSDPAVLDLYRRYEKAHANFSVRRKVQPFNFSRAVNQGMAAASGEHVLLLNNDISITESDWLAEMVDCLSFRNAGIVGAKLLYPNDTLQHAGVIAGFGGLAGHWYLGKAKNFGGPMNRLHVRASMTCVTGAAMLISRGCRQAVGDFDEANFAIAYNDVDYCLRAYDRGYRTVWTPFACLYHHESATRGAERGPAKQERFDREKENLRRIHGTTDFVDPATSPFHGRGFSTPKLARPDHLPPARIWSRTVTSAKPDRHSGRRDTPAR